MLSPLVEGVSNISDWVEFVKVKKCPLICYLKPSFVHWYSRFATLILSCAVLILAQSPLLLIALYSSIAMLILNCALTSFMLSPLVEGVSNITG